VFACRDKKACDAREDTIKQYKDWGYAEILMVVIDSKEEDED
jgi:hypothetical protein